MTKPVKPAYLKPDEAFDFYLAMGGLRMTIKELAVRLKRQSGVRAPGYETLRKWSIRHNWKQRAQEHDRAVGGRLSEIRIDEDARDIWDARKGFKTSSRNLMIKIDEAIKGLTLKTLSEIDKASEIVDRLMARAALLPGGTATSAEAVGAASGNAEEDEVVDQAILDRFKRLTNGASGTPN